MRRIAADSAQRGLSMVIAVTFLCSLFAPYRALAQSSDPEPVWVELAPASNATPAATREVVAADEHPADDEPSEPDKSETDPGDEPAEDAVEDADASGTARPQTVQALPNGPAKSAVTPQAISLPSAEGSIEGMGESFTPNLSAGTGTFSVPIALPAGRAGVQPSLALSYSTSGGNGPVGVGWSLAAPFIARQTDQGLPRYVDGAAWTAEEDGFIYNGGQELVPVDNEDAAALDGALIPAELEGWQQYRARVEGAFMRFFRAPDGLSWVVQDKSGTRFDFGVLPSGDGPTEMLSASLDSLTSEYEHGTGRVFSWNLTRMSDAHGSTVYYRYFADQNQTYLSDIHYVSPVACDDDTPSARRACASSLASYGRRVRLVYEDRDDVYDSYTTTWRTATAKRLARVEVTSFDSTASQRTLVRRYHLRYDPTSFISLLAEVQVEGRPDDFNAFDVSVGSRAVAESALGASIVGRLLPPMRFSYSQAREVSSARIPGFGGLNGEVRLSPSSPPVSVNEDRADLLDVNSDGLPDVIVTDPAHHRTAGGAPAVGVYFNGFSGQDARPGVAGGFSAAVPMGIPGGQSSVLNLGNLNINPMDMDGDGRSDLLHMPRLANYGYFTPSRASDVDASYAVSPAEQSWEWMKKEVALPSGQLDPRIDFGRDSARIKVVDVNNDHLIDVVRTTGTEMQTFLNLGWLPGGDGRFGSATYSGSSWTLSTTPISSCVLHLGLPVDFGDPEVRLADMNGDGIQDIVKVRQGRVAYWPGRGTGLWGVGEPSCDDGTATDREIDMLDPPQQVNVELENVFFSDVNMDGASDMVQVRFDAIDVWLNVAGQSFTDRIILDDTPAEPGFANRVRFADLDGSGTTDIVYGDANNWRYVDPMGGTRPRLLIGVENGLGGLTTLEYESSAVDYLRDLREAETCQDSSCERFTWSRVSDACDAKISGTCAHRSGGSPVISSVVRAVETTDQFASVGAGQSDFVKRTEYRYHDGYYEGIEQEFRGFGVADAVELGDAAHPTSITRTHFDQGRRPGGVASDRIADNPNEALKGRTFLTEVFDEQGAYLSTSHASLTVRDLLTGLDDRTVSYAFVSQSDELRYDTGPFVAGAGEAISVPEVVRQRASGLDDFTAGPPVDGEPDTRELIARSPHYAHIRTTIDSVDNVGHVHAQTAHGRMRGENGEPLPNEQIVTHTTPTLCNSEQYIWRTEQTFVTGHGDATHLGVTQSTYDPTTCDLRRTVTTAAVPIAFEFGGTSVQLEQATQEIESSTNYDSWGNAIRSCAGALLPDDTEEIAECLRFGEVEYDEAFAQFPIREQIATGRTATHFTQLSTTASWDEGLGVLTEVTDPNDLTTELTYDGLGRLTSLTPPDVDRAEGGPAKPLTRIAYTLADELNAPVSLITTTTAFDTDAESTSTQVSHAFVDGLGRTRAALLQAEDASNPALASRWQRSGITRFTARGSVVETFQSDLVPSGGDLLDSALTTPAASIPSTFSFYDAFGRVTRAVAEDGSAARSIYHALSTDTWDPNDLDPSSPHFGTFATERQDGHGRSIDQVLRNRQVGRSDIEYYRLWTDYRADGQVVQVTRAETTNDVPRAWSVVSARTGRPHVTSRQLFHDTAGRRIASTDPDTDSRSPTRTAANRTWRYLFNRVGDLAAVRDPRGCGENFYYDHAGRLVAEHYVGCDEAQDGATESSDTKEIPIENVPAGAIGLEPGDGAMLGADARFYFDEYPSWFASLGGAGSMPEGAEDEEHVRGRATAVMDRGQRSVLAYDSLGRAIWSARQLAVVPDEAPIDPTLATLSVVTDDASSAGFVAYDAAHTYTRTASFDYASRPLAMSVEAFAGVDRRVEGSLAYNARGLPTSASATVGFGSGSHTREVVDRIDYTRDGLVAAVQYGESDSSTDGPLSETFYDIRRRPLRMLTTRTPGAAAGTSATQEDRPLDAVSIIVDQTLIWDRSSNLVELFDSRPGDEWPDGFRPASYRASHDALYRVAGVELDYTQDTGARTPSDDFVDYRDEMAEVEAADPMQTKPAPMLPAPTDGRVASLTYEYDWLANMVESTDDAYQFYERSLGSIGNGFEENGGRPSALRLASDLDRSAPNNAWTPAGGRGGWLEVEYGEGGNAVALTVRAQCADADFGAGETCHDPVANLGERADWMRDNCVCAQEQHYRYRYDELNRMVEARRYDRAGGTGSWALEARQRYRYDSGNSRTVKQTVAVGAGGGADPERIALYVFAGDFERRGLVRDVEEDQYVAAASGRQEDQYLVAGARMVWTTPASGAVATLEADHRVTVALGDVLGTSGAVVDLASGEVVEASTYYPSGGRESYRGGGDAGEVGAEAVGFTGKEGDEEVGVTYFGERYLIGRLGRWATPDPLSVHALGGGEFGNSYHYVGGSLLQARDPRGLVVETIWDIANVVMDVASLASNLAEGNWSAAAVDAAGLAADALATAIPGVPGGAGTAIKVARAADKAVDAAKAVDKTADVARVADKAADAAKAAKKELTSAKAGRKTPGDAERVAPELKTDAQGRLRDSQGRYAKDPESPPRDLDSTSPSSSKTHGNKLDDKPAEGYTLRDRDTGEVKKYGETTRGEDKFGAQKRYSKKELKEKNVEYHKEASGTKKEMHEWQHKKIKEHKEAQGKRPDLNKNDY